MKKISKIKTEEIISEFGDLPSMISPNGLNPDAKFNKTRIAWSNECSVPNYFGKTKELDDYRVIHQVNIRLLKAFEKIENSYKIYKIDLKRGGGIKIFKFNKNSDLLYSININLINIDPKSLGVYVIPKLKTLIHIGFPGLVSIFALDKEIAGDLFDVFIYYDFNILHEN